MVAPERLERRPVGTVTGDKAWEEPHLGAFLAEVKSLGLNLSTSLMPGDR